MAATRLTHALNSIQVVPWDYDVNSEKWDGLFYSNGPGDPSMAAPTIKYLREAIKVGMYLSTQLVSIVFQCLPLCSLGRRSVLFS